MKTVVIYSFRGRFAGKAEYEYTYPKVGDTHNCLCFISQDNEELEFENAVNESLKYGFTDTENWAGNPLKVEVLNTEGYRRFSGFYEEALNEGSSLVYYPNT